MAGRVLGGRSVALRGSFPLSGRVLPVSGRVETRKSSPAWCGRRARGSGRAVFTGDVWAVSLVGLGGPSTVSFTLSPWFWGFGPGIVYEMGRKPDRGKARLRVIAVRLGDDGAQDVKSRAERHGEPQSSWVRRAIWFALAGMPRGWKPGVPVAGDLHCGGCRCGSPGSGRSGADGGLRVERFTDAP